MQFQPGNKKWQLRPTFSVNALYNVWKQLNRNEPLHSEILEKNNISLNKHTVSSLHNDFIFPPFCLFDFLMYFTSTFSLSCISLFVISSYLILCCTLLSSFRISWNLKFLWKNWWNTKCGQSFANRLETTRCAINLTTVLTQTDSYISSNELSVGLSPTLLNHAKCSSWGHSFMSADDNHNGNLEASLGTFLKYQFQRNVGNGLGGDSKKEKWSSFEEKVLTIPWLRLSSCNAPLPQRNQSKHNFVNRVALQLQSPIATSPVILSSKLRFWTKCLNWKLSRHLKPNIFVAPRTIPSFKPIQLCGYKYLFGRLFIWDFPRVSFMPI
jgi:hypothetical protein